MGEWYIGAFINIIGSIAINFGTNLLKLGHDQREKLSLLGNDGNGKSIPKSIIYFHTWRLGIVFFALGNCLNFVSFAYAAQSLLAALGSIQFVSNIAFAYFVLCKTVTVKVMVATAFIVFGNIFLVSFGNHQSPVFTPEQLVEKYTNMVFLLYCASLFLVVTLNHYIYRRGEASLSIGRDITFFRGTMLPFSYAVVSGAIGSFSVLFAKSLSNMLRLTMSSDYQFHNWFTYTMLLLFLCTAGFWMARLNEGLSLFDAILIVPMFQIAWTFFSICTGFIYFQEYQVFNMLKITMFLLGIAFVFLGISLLAPDDYRVLKESPTLCASQSLPIDLNRLSVEPDEANNKSDSGSLVTSMLGKGRYLVMKARDACSVSLGLAEESISTSSVLVMPMLSSRTTGFRGTKLGSVKFIPLSSSDWGGDLSIEDDYDDAEQHIDGRTTLLY